MKRIISLVVPVFNEEESLNELYDRVLESIKRIIKKNLVESYEIWFVNDGCTDNSEGVIKELLVKIRMYISFLSEKILEKRELYKLGLDM